MGFSKVIKLANTGAATKRHFPHLLLRATLYQDDCVALEVPSLCPIQGQFLFLLPIMCSTGKHEPRKRHPAVRLMSPVWMVIWSWEHHSPAVHNDGPSTRWVGQLDSPNEGEKPRGVVWNTMVRPASEVELFDFTDFVIAPLCKDRKQSLRKDPEKVIKYTQFEWPWKQHFPKFYFTHFFFKRVLV